MSSSQYPTGTGPTGATGATGATGGLTSRTTASVTTGTLANNATETDTISLAPTFCAMKVVVGSAARVRLYSTAAARDADLARPFTSSLLDPPYGGTQNGCILDLFLLDSSDWTWVLTPEVQGSNVESSPSADIAYSITNLGISGTVTVTISYFPLEV